MLVFLGLDWDSAPMRAAKLKALQDYFSTSAAKALTMLSGTALSKANSERGKVLVINSHGNEQVFGGYDAEAFMQQLQARGFEDGAFDAVYLMACNSGKQDQDNTTINTFATQLKRKFANAGVKTKLYATRGTLTYRYKTEQVDHQTFYVITEMYVHSPERNYPLSEGLLLVT